jgi:predicted RNase H-like nuclease
MRTVLGIDAAWTERNASGVAVAAEDANGWQLKGAWPSVAHFLADAYGHPSPDKPSGGVAPANDLLSAARGLVGRLPDLVAIDMPMALEPITGRRASDDALSRAYGAKWCAAHSPSAVRPGPISDQLRHGFEEAGYSARAELRREVWHDNMLDDPYLAKIVLGSAPSRDS